MNSHHWHFHNSLVPCMTEWHDGKEEIEWKKKTKGKKSTIFMTIILFALWINNFLFLLPLPLPYYVYLPLHVFFHLMCTLCRPLFFHRRRWVHKKRSLLSRSLNSQFNFIFTIERKWVCEVVPRKEEANKNGFLFSVWCFLKEDAPLSIARFQSLYDVHVM